MKDRDKLLNKMKDIAEQEFGIDDLDRKCRKRIYVNARCWFYTSCRKIREIKISHEAATRFLDQDHATSVHAVKEYDTNVRFDGFAECYRTADSALAKYLGQDHPYDPIKWRDRKIERIKKLYRAKPTQGAILEAVLDSVGVAMKNGKTSRSEIEKAIKETCVN